VFERVVQACIAASLVGGEGFAVDASLIVTPTSNARSQTVGTRIVIRRWRVLLTVFPFLTNTERS
jgi:hypothetical protein